MRDRNDLPNFKVTRSDRRSLVDQLADGIRQAIATGFYRAGDMLPRMTELARHYRVSVRIPREAIHKLSVEGWLDPRPGVGITILPRRVPAWRGHVLFVLPDAEGSYYANVFSSELQNHLAKAGWLLTRVNVLRHANGWRDNSNLASALSQTFNLAVVLYGDVFVEKLLTKKGVPYVVIAAERPREPVPHGFVRFNRYGAVGDFVRHCRSAGVRRVVQVCMEGEGDVDAVPALCKAGIAARREVVHFDDSCGRLEQIERASFDAVFNRIAEAAKAAGELVFFTDDFLAFGGITALLARRVEIPRELQVVAWANRGFAPVGPWPVTRMELDPYENAETIAKLVIGRLTGTPIPGNAAVSPKYIVGKTFPR
ncbi:MAG: GntR family transcriptional regulator [Kiritimatiellia bacterium]